MEYKGSTREEEVERFSKASKDAEFARMLKQRNLSPDHLETQAQLRRDIRVSVLIAGMTTNCIELDFRPFVDAYSNLKSTSRLPRES